MDEPTDPDSSKNEFAASEFEGAASGPQRRGMFGEFLGFMSHHKKWWLLPIVLVLAALGVLVAAGGSAAAPFIYALF